MSRKFVRQYPLTLPGVLVDPSRGIVFDWGTTVPTDTTLGYAPGAIFIDVDAAAGSQVWINEGTKASSLFVRNITAGSAAQTIGTLNATNVNVASALNMAANSTVTMAANSNFALSAVNGTQWGTNNSQKQSFWGVAPVVQPSAQGSTAGINGNAATNGNANATNFNFNGNFGSTAYTINDLVYAMKKIGAIPV